MIRFVVSCVLLLTAVFGQAPRAFGEFVESISKVESASAETFRLQMYESVFMSNYKLVPHSYKLSSKRLLNRVVYSNPLFLEFISERVFEICRERSGSMDTCSSARADVLVTKDFSRIHLKDQSDLFANWLFALDGDNWFGLDDAAAESESYLNGSNRMLAMLPSFRPDGVMTDLLSTEGLPVVVDYTELTITLWTNELAD